MFWRRIWILLRFKERLVQMAMTRSAAAHATSPGSSIVRLITPCQTMTRLCCGQAIRSPASLLLGVSGRTCCPLLTRCTTHSSHRLLVAQ